ncbi:18S rRNA maturation protein [Quaeritorhiza haematococci]|nr:18S rRNA maturation protein [Quaeritorhiza haematococci]
MDSDGGPPAKKARTSNSSNPKYGKKQGKQNKQGKGKNEPGTAVLKKQIRDTERVLRRPNLTAVQQQDAERRLKALKIQLNKIQEEKEVKKLFAKYKYVRFVERKKVTRRINQLKSKLDVICSSSSSSTTANTKKPKRPNLDSITKAYGTTDLSLLKTTISSQLAEQEWNLLYVDHFPVDMKYVSLFPVGHKDEDDEEDDESEEGEMKGNSKKRKIDSMDLMGVGDEEEEEDEEDEDEDQDSRTKSAAKKHTKDSNPTTTTESTTLTAESKSDLLRDAVKERLRQAVASGLVKKSGFKLRKADFVPGGGKNSEEDGVDLEKDVEGADEEGPRKGSQTKMGKGGKGNVKNKDTGKNGKGQKPNNKGAWKGKQKEQESDGGSGDDDADDFFL